MFDTDYSDQCSRSVLHRVSKSACVVFKMAKRMEILLGVETLGGPSSIVLPVSGSVAVPINLWRGEGSVGNFVYCSVTWGVKYGHHQITWPTHYYYYQYIANIIRGSSVFYLSLTVIVNFEFVFVVDKR